MYLACVHSDPFHFLPVWSLLSPQKAGPGLFRLKKIGIVSDNKKGVKFSRQLWPQCLGMRSRPGWVSFTSRWQANNPGGEKTALAKWFDDTRSFMPLWNADCAIFFVKQDSHWVEDKQLFIKRNQELLEKVCGAQHPSGAEERMMRDRSQTADSILVDVITTDFNLVTCFKLYSYDSYLFYTIYWIYFKILNDADNVDGFTAIHLFVLAKYDPISYDFWWSSFQMKDATIICTILYSTWETIHLRTCCSFFF